MPHHHRSQPPSDLTRQIPACAQAAEKAVRARLTQKRRKPNTLTKDNHKRSDLDELPQHSVRRKRQYFILLSDGLALVERSRDWIEQAEWDHSHAMSDLERGFYDWACFSAQQAAEKAVKAVFQKLTAEGWSHSVTDLLNELPKEVRPGDHLVDGALELDKAYISARYPHVHPSGSPRNRYTRKEAERLTGYAEEIIDFCKSSLSKTH